MFSSGLREALIFYKYGKKCLNDPIYKNAKKKSEIQDSEQFSRTDVINKILSRKSGETFYLEIGVRNPDDNFNFIKASKKYSCDPGNESKVNKADFKLKSDVFFELLNKNKILSSEIKFDVIFIDGLHLAEQVDKDISNSLKFIKNDGFIILHDCNPPTEWHARESFEFYNTPAEGAWNGTVWKSFLKMRFDHSLYSCCIDTDWGVGIISKTMRIGNSIKSTNPFFEYKEFDKNRKKYLNLISVVEFNNIF